MYYVCIAAVVFLLLCFYSSLNFVIKITEIGNIKQNYNDYNIMMMVLPPLICLHNMNQKQIHNVSQYF